MTRAVRLTGPRSIDVTTIAAPALRLGELRVRTLASGVSTGTELTAYRGTNPNLTSRWDPHLHLFMGAEGPPSYPLTGWGYSEVGEVVEISPLDDAGGGGSEADIRVGDVVWGIWGHVSDAVLPIERLRGHKLPHGLDPVVGCFARVGAIALNAVLAADAGLGETVVVVGQGVIGLLATSFAAQSGARVIAVEGIPARRELALQLGAHEAIGPGPNVAPTIRERTSGRGADVAIELSGVVTALHEAIRLVGPDGRVVAAGFYQGGASDLRLGEEFHHNRVEVVASQIGAVPPHKRARWDVPRLQGTVVGLLASGQPDVTRLVSHRFDIEDAARAYELLDTEPATALQVVFEFPAGAVP